MRSKLLMLVLSAVMGTTCGLEEASTEAAEPSADELGQAESQVISGYSVLRNRGTNKCLDGYSAASGAGAAPYQYDCNSGNSYQR